MSTTAVGHRGHQRRLPVGDLLFGALYLRGTVPLDFAELGRIATGSGLDKHQVLTWISRAEAGGLVERLAYHEDDSEDFHRGLRLTETGFEVARQNRRLHDRRAGEFDPQDTGWLSTM